jgi:3'-phosphoadenosine 5'-phosphosulfate (PAPS) 3'-phosphatase
MSFSWNNQVVWNNSLPSTMDISPSNDGEIQSFSGISTQSEVSSKATQMVSNGLQLDADISRVVTDSFDSISDMVINDISITELLSTCIDACRRGCEVIRNVRHKLVQSSNVVGSDSQFFCCGAVKYKISNDPRSALTEADEASQNVITECLNNCWAKEICSGLIKIVGEEDEGDGNFVTSVSHHDMMAHFDRYNTPRPDLEPIQRNLLHPSDSTQVIDSSSESSSNKRNELIIFIDPMDGTREFVENRIENVQCLIGITLNGKPIAGAVGMPMVHENKIEVAYGIDFPADREHATSTPLSKVSGVKYFNALNPLFKRLSVTDTGMGDYVDGEEDVRKLVVLSGDSKKPALKLAMKCLKSDVLGKYGESAPPIRTIVAGGCGNKMLFVQRRFQALSEKIPSHEGNYSSSIIGSISLAPPGSSSWDTAGPTALLLAADPNAIVTDLVGRPLVYDGEHLSNECGVVVSAGFVATRIHREMCEKLRRDAAFCEVLGVVRGAVHGDTEII